MQPLLDNLVEIEMLAEKVNAFYKNLMSATKEDSTALEKQKRALVSKIGYNIIGVPFTNQDAQMYALDKKLDFEELELHGNLGNKNAMKETKCEFEHINIRVRKPLKTLAVKHVNNSDHKNLTQYIEYLIKKDLEN